MTVTTAAQPASGVAAAYQGLTQNLHHPLSHPFVELLVIIAASRLIRARFESRDVAPVPAHS